MLGFVVTFALFVVAQSPLLVALSGAPLAGFQATLAWIAVGVAFLVTVIGLAVSFFTRPKPPVPGARRSFGG